MLTGFFYVEITLPILSHLSNFSLISGELDDKIYHHKELINLIENQTIEFKREYNDKARNTMLAFLNTDGGTLYLGLADDGTVYGVAGDTEPEIRKITTSFRDSVTPDPTGYFTVEPEKRDEKYIIRITVERGSAIPSISG